MSEALKKVKPVYYLYGEEDYLIEEALKTVKKLTLTKGFESLNYQVYEAGTLETSKVIEAARTLPVFSGMRLIIVKGAEDIGGKKEEERKREEEFLEYAKSPCPSTCLVFVSAGRKVAWASPLFRHLKTVNCTKEYKTLTGEELKGWVEDYVKKNNRDITAGAVEKLMTFAGKKLRDIKGELDKIITFAGEKNRIDEEDVTGCAISIADSTAFNLADAIWRKDAARALQILSQLEGEEPLKILGAIAWHLRILIKVKEYQKKGIEPYKMSGLLRKSPRDIGCYIKGGRNFSQEELLSSLVRLSRADIEFKSSRLSHGFMLSRLIIELCAKGRAFPAGPAPVPVP